MPVVIVSVVFVISAVACHVIARNKGERAAYWGVAGLLLGPLAVFYLLLFK
ncbi:MAG: hypothetical protein PVJ63_10260 [Thioalkalispiraceae bacterium]|jgi:hypothetical protein